MNRLAKFTKTYIESIPKTTNDNNCWIPFRRPDEDGYIRIATGRYPNSRRFKLHRIVMCVYNNVNYDDREIESRHSTGCSRACFNPEHIKPGSKSNNVIDSVRDRTHRNSSKIVCSICGGQYSLRTKYGRVIRFCRVCNRARKT